MPLAMSKIQISLHLSDKIDGKIKLLPVYRNKIRR